MTEERVQEISSLLSAKYDGELRALFYTKKGLPRQRLYTKENILSLLGITDEMNSLEYMGVRQKLSASLAFIRKEARESRLQFVDFHNSSKEGGREIAYHGFMSDIDKMVSTIELYNKRAESSRFIAKVTNDIMMSGITYLESGQQELITE